MPTQGRDRLHGTLDALILKTLAKGPRHGYAICRWLHERSAEAIVVEEGSLYPALYRMTRKGWIAGDWGVSENNRRAKFYRLTPEGRAQLLEQSTGWQRLAAAVTKAITATAAPAAAPAPTPAG